MGHHYVPQYYLSGFTNASNKIYVYEKDNQRVFCAGTRRVANETNYYSEELEEYLANEVENSANKVIKKIRDRQEITTLDKVLLSKYIIVMLKRVPSGKNRYKAKSPEILDTVLDDLENELIDLINQNPQLPHLKKKREELERIRLKIKSGSKLVDELIEDTWLTNLPSHMTPRSIKALSLMNWRFLVKDKKTAFLTSDNPVFFFDNIGIGNQESEVTFPISSNIALLATWKSHLKEGYFQAKESYIHQINRRTVSIATKYVFHSDKKNWVIKLVNRKKHNVRKLI